MTLLIVDDEAEICELMKEFLSEEIPHKIVTAQTYADALKLLEEKKPEGMLLDIRLKGKRSGLDLLSKTRQVSPDTKTIMVTASSDFTSIQTARARGAVDYITKPFTLTYLEKVVKTKLLQLLAV